MKESIQRKRLHVQVAEVIRSQVIRHRQPGERIASERQLALQLGVSPLTLRQALSVLEHEGLLVRRHGSGTFVAQHAEPPHIVIFTSLSPSIRDTDYQTRLFWLCGSLLRERGHVVRLQVLPEVLREEQWSPFYRQVASGQITGALFIAMHPGPVATVLEQHAVPFLTTGENFPHGVLIDHMAAVRQGTQHLLAFGCRKIALMQWEYALSAESQARALAAFRELLAEAGAVTHEPWLRHAVPPHVPGAGWEQFRDLWAARGDKPDGLLVLDDVLFRDVALGILDSHIRVPTQLQVVAHANKGAGFAYPFPVSVLEIDPHEVAQAMADRLGRLIRREQVDPPVHFIQPRLVPAELSHQALIPVR